MTMGRLRREGKDKALQASPTPAGSGNRGSRVTWGGSFSLCAAADTTPPTTICHLPSLKTHCNSNHLATVGKAEMLILALLSSSTLSLLGAM